MQLLIDGLHKRAIEKVKAVFGFLNMDKQVVVSLLVQLGLVWHARAHEGAELQPQALTTHRQVHSCPPLKPQLADAGNVVRLPWVPDIAQTFSPNVSGAVCCRCRSLNQLPQGSERAGELGLVVESKLCSCAPVCSGVCIVLPGMRVYQLQHGDKQNPIERTIHVQNSQVLLTRYSTRTIRLTNQ